MIVSKCHQDYVKVIGMGADAYFVCCQCGKRTDTMVSFMWDAYHDDDESRCEVERFDRAT